MISTSLKTYSAASVLEAMKVAKNCNRYLGRQGSSRCPRLVNM